MTRRKAFITPRAPKTAYNQERKYGGPIKSKQYRKPTRVSFTPSGFDSDAKLRKHIDNLKITSVKGLEKPTFSNVAKFIGDTKSKKNYRIKTSVGVNFSVGKITPPAGLGQEDDGKSIHITHDVKVKTLILGSDPVKQYSKKIETGVPSAKAIVQAAKQNGTTTATLFNTKTATVTDKEYFSRDQLTFGTGFNQKGITVPGDNAYVTYEDMRALTQGTTADEAMAANKLQRIMASVLQSRTEFTLRNQSAHLRAHIKVHLVTHKPGLNALFSPIEDMNTSVFYSSLTSVDTAARRTKIPNSFQYTEGKLESSGSTSETAAPNQMFSVDVDPSVSVLNYSPYFKEHFEIVGTVNQMLGPGDFLNFAHVHHYGQGFDITKIYAAAPVSNLLDNLRNKPVSYFYMIEYKGYPCEVTYNRAGKYEHHIGTNPVILSSEMRKKLVYVNPNRSMDALTFVGVEDKMHFRVFTPTVDAEIGGLNKKFNLNLFDWTGVASPADTKYVIQVASDRTLRTDVHVAGNANASDING